MRRPGLIGRSIEQPLAIVLGVLAAASAAKSGYGAWAAAVIVFLVPIWISKGTALIADRRLAARLDYAEYGGRGTRDASKLLPA
jgi:hypothetical protein